MKLKVTYLRSFLFNYYELFVIGNICVHVVTFDKVILSDSFNCFISYLSANPKTILLHFLTHPRGLVESLHLCNHV